MVYIGVIVMEFQNKAVASQIQVCVLDGNLGDYKTFRRLPVPKNKLAKKLVTATA